jgi:amino acid transporter
LLSFAISLTKLVRDPKINHEDDQKILTDMGYTQELYRGISGWFMNFAFTLTEVSIISSYSILFGTGLVTGGPVVMVWGWIIGASFTILVGLSLAELCSRYPSAGSVYHWSGQLASAKYAPFASYITGWWNFLGNAAGVASFASGFAQILGAAVVLGSGNPLSIGNQVCISILILAVWSVLNIMRINQQGWINNFATVFQILSCVIIVTALLSSMPDHASAEFVFATFNSDIGLDNTGYVTLVGLLTTLFTFVGYEAGGHIAEETRGARVAAPKGIVATVIVGASLGLFYLLGLLFATPSIDAVVNGDSDSEIVNLFSIVCGTKGGLALTSLVIINLFFAGVSSMTITTRITYSMARDGAFPGSNYLYHVSPATRSPMRTVLMIYVFVAILLLLPLVNETAFGAIVSLCTVGFQVSYAIPIYLRVTTARNSFQPGNFHLGRASIIIGWLSALWLTFTSVLFFWPLEFPVTRDSMNWTVVVVAGVMFICMFFWIVSARHWFVGPKRKEKDVDYDVELTVSNHETK